MRKSKEKSVELMTRILKMDPESAASTYEVFLKTLSPDGIPVPRRHGQSGEVDPGPRALSSTRNRRSAISPTTVWRGKWLKN